MITRRKYLNYTTPWGIDLTRVAKAGWSSFLIHESGYQQRLTGWNHEGVDSPFWRFYHNPKPGCHLQFQGRRIPLEPRSAVLIPEDTVFDCCGPVSTSHLWIHFTVSRPGTAIRRQPLVMAMDHLLISLVDELIALHTRPEAPARDYQLHHHSAALLHIVFSRIDAPIPPTIPDRLLQVIDLIHHAPHGDLSNPFLATSAGMSVERFVRTFREHTGHTPAAYVIATRIKAAEVALALTDKTIDQIAAECGFPNRHYFSRVFARQIGCGPAEFRVRQRERKGR